MLHFCAKLVTFILTSGFVQ